MPRLDFEMAAALFQTTIPGIPILAHGAISDEVVEGIAAEESVYLFRIFDYRLSTSIRKIGGWTFVCENDFLNEAVARIFLAWDWFDGQTNPENPLLTTAMRHCFKRFYAEASIGEYNTRFGRAMLVESAVFERELLRPMNDSQSAHSERSDYAESIVDFARLICRWHEIGHYRLEKLNVSPLDLADDLFEGLATKYLKAAMDVGDHALAEELYCDLFSFQEVLNSKSSTLKLLDYESKVRIALFSYVVTSILSLVGFVARLDARDYALKRLRSSYFTNEYSALLQQMRRRIEIVEDIIGHYSVRKNFHVHGGGPGYHLKVQLSAFFNSIYYTYKEPSEKMVFGQTLCDAEYRRIADYISLGMSTDTITGEYLLACSQDFGTLELEPEEWAPIIY